MEIMEEETENKYPGKPDNFQFREPFVLSPMICLMMLCGMTLSVEIFMFKNRTFDTSIMSKFNVIHPLPTLIPTIATLLVAFLSELKGRKAALTTLSAVSIVSTILHAIPNQACIMAGYTLQGVVTGGVFSTTFLAISEFCSPKHRFAYLIANLVALSIGTELTSLLSWIKVLRVENVYVQFLQVVLEVGCLAVVSLGPESPYWLARQGRLEESRLALLWLRGEGSEAELSSLQQQKNNRGPPRLFWLPLLSGISAISVTIFSSWLAYTLTIAFNNVLNHQIQHAVNLAFAIIYIPIITTLSYKFNHKSMFVAMSLITFSLISAFAGWLYFVHGWIDIGERNDYQIVKYFVHSCIALLTWGSCLFGVVMCVEVIPPKYNTYVVCVCFVYYSILNTIPGLIDIKSYLPINGLAILCTSLSLFSVNVFFFLSHETKGKMLLDIQKLYMPRQRNRGLESESKHRKN